MHNVIIGTAGHVDHGKTSLIKALSGIDTDRLMEEKKRGITIELGFANLSNDRGEHIGIIDVPGHEKFVKNMLAGIGGIDIVLFVIALDEGVMPQTIEHFEILKMLGIKKGIIVYTKADLEDKKMTEVIDSDVSELVKNSFLENADRIKVSVATGQNLDELKKLIFKNIEGIKSKNTEKELMRLPIDRVFTIEGFGTVVTGTLMEGRVDLNDELKIYPKGIDVKVRNIQSHSIDVESAFSGQRVAINLSNVKKTDIERGDVLCEKDSILVTKGIDVFIKVFESSKRSIKNGDSLHFNYGSRQTECKVYLLSKDILNNNDSDYAHIVFDKDICIKKDDKFIVRYFSPVESIGGGFVIDPDADKHKRKNIKVLEYLDKMSNSDVTNQIEMFINNFTNILTDKKLLKLRLHLTEDEINKNIDILIDNKKIVKLDDSYYVSFEFYDRLVDFSTNILSEFHKQNEVVKGMNKEEFKSKIIMEFKLANEKEADIIINSLIKNKKIHLSDGVLQKIGFTGGISDKNKILADKIIKIYKDANIEIPKVDEVLVNFGDKKLARQIINDCSKNNILLKIDNDYYMYKDNFNVVLDKIYNYYEKNKEMTLADLRDMLSTSRKYALLILDTCDRLKITKRVNDARCLIKKIKL